MRSGRQRSWRRGFTLVETLAAAAIVIILLGISAAGVAHYARWLKIAELDNAAREIYLAAENRAVLLSGSDRLEKIVSNPEQSVAVTLGSGSDSSALGYYIYHSGGSGALSELLSLETIDPALLDGSFYIVYEPMGGSVTDVFYAESAPNVGGDFQKFYQDVSTKSQSTRMKMKPMVGYYGGGAAENARAGALGVPIVTVRNGEELTAEITYAVLTSMAEKAELAVELDYGGCKVNISPDASSLSKTESYGRTRFSCTITLDSLDEPHFSEWFKSAEGAPASFGGEFTVTATLSAKDGSSASSSSSGTGNSLFAEGSDADTAYIANLRHLQNLDKNTSGVAGKTKAEQQKNNIDCAAHSFTPIENAELKSYDGGSFALRGLRALGAEGGSAGLFGDVSGFTFRNIRMVNASAMVNTPAESTDAAEEDAAAEDTVPAEGTGRAGALAGSATNTEFENCWVYWEPEAGSAGLRGVLGDDQSSYNYQITAAAAGGLAGRMAGGSIKDCLAATLVNGTATAGGLVGQMSGAVTVTGSYADCYLTGNGKVGGLVGTAEALTLNDCFAAGFIDIPEADVQSVAAAGLCADGSVGGRTVYSAMRRSDTLEKWAPLTPQMVSAYEFYYLSLDMSDWVTPHVKTYKHMTSNDFVEELNKTVDGGSDEKPGGAFGWKGQGSRPYNLRTGLALSAYDFPGLTDLPHYGDWSAQFVAASLVYYEQYDADVYGFYGGGVDALQNVQPVKDGYAIAVPAEGDSLTVKIEGVGEYTYSTNATAENGFKPLYTVTRTEKEQYYLALLPDELVNVDTAPEGFYQSLSFTINNETHNYFYCPHFAKTAVKADVKPAAPESVSVRTPRHLYMISKCPEYYNGKYNFHQELELDYSYYTGYNLFPQGVFTQPSIGSFGQPFNGLYDGGCHAIRNLRFRALTGTGGNTPVYAGLFGYSSGTLRNIVYLMDAASPSAVSLGRQNILYFGGLAGGNAGNIANCAVAGASLTGYAYTATAYIGGLVGLNQGDISNSAAECAALAADTSSYAHAYVGGLAGLNRNSGLISASYAVGRASADADETSGARVCGFVGYNHGLIKNSYAAMDLASSGKAVETYGFCGVTDGTQNGTVFLNSGNFTYRGVPYNASYTPRGATGLGYDVLTDREALPVAGMSFVAAAEGADEVRFPYPTAVHDAAGKPAHYGEWPGQMKLGSMGVYYWEKLVMEDKTTTYHLSMLTADPETHTITRQSTLSDAHSDGGVVTDYGYGYYSEEGASVALTAEDINYVEKGWTKKNDPVGDTFVPSTAEEDTEANDALAALMPGFVFHSYHSYGMEADGGGLYPAGSYTDPDHTTKQMSTSGTRYNTVNIKDYTRKPNGTFILRQIDPNTLKSSLTIEFTINPHFADALSVIADGLVENTDGLVESPQQSGWKLAGGTPAEAPGTAGNPCQVRALSQLQNINWCVRPFGGSDKKVDGLSNTTVTNNAANGFYGGNQYGFLYLSHDVRWVGNNVSAAYNYSWSELYDYHWVQTHDIDGKGSGFFPIAAFQDKTNGGSNASGVEGTAILTAWFGGSYDGGDYTIKNINIAAENTNCVGLFGVTLDATLKNIILYSESGENTVTVNGPEAFNSTFSWYAAGGLVGLAGTSAENTSADKTISNCSVSGYRIVDLTAHCNNLQYGAAAVGGLVGVCNLDLKNCTATTTIEMSYSRDKNDSTDGSPVRVGGLAGTCVASVENCYAGGEIRKLNEDLTLGNIHLGGLVGGAGMRRMYVPYFQVSPANDAAITISNSYSTVQMPEKNTTAGGATDGKIQDSEAIGGLGGGNMAGAAYTVTVSNCYALQSAGSEYYGNTDGVGVTALTYRQLAGDDLIYIQTTEGESADSQPTEGEPADIQPTEGEPADIQTTEGESSDSQPTEGESAGGQPTGDESVVSRNIYQLLSAFSPVTAQTDDGFSVAGKYSFTSAPGLQGLNYPFPTILTRENGRYHVHYGDWPFAGIKRDAGGAPITLDLFTKPSCTEKLDMEGIGPGGVWSVKAEPMNTGETDEEGNPVTKEIVTAKIADDGTLTVTGSGVGVTTLTVTCKANGVEYTLTLSVSVTAVLDLRAGENLVGLFTNDTVELQMAGYGNTNSVLLWNELGVTVTEAKVEAFDSNRLEKAEMGGMSDDGKWPLTLTTTEKTGDTTVSINFTYSYKDVEYTGLSAVTLHVEEPEIETDGSKRIVVFKDGTIEDAVVTSENLDEEKLQIDETDNSRVSLDLADVPPETEVTVEVTVEINGRKHAVKVTVTAPAADSTPGQEEDESRTGDGDQTE